MKKTRLHFFFKLFRKCLEFWKRRLWNFHQNLSIKKFNIIFSIIGGSDPPPLHTHVFVGDCVPYTPYKGFCPQSLNEIQLIEIRVNWFSCIAGQCFWIRFNFWIFDIFMIRFWNKFYKRFFFMILTSLRLFFHREKKNCFENFSSPKNFLFSKLITKLIANLLPGNIG